MTVAAQTEYRMFLALRWTAACCYLNTISCGFQMQKDKLIMWSFVNRKVSKFPS